MLAWGSIPKLRFKKPLQSPIRTQHYTKTSYDYSRLLQSSPLRPTHAQIIVAGHAENPFLAAKLVSRYCYLGTQGIEDARHLFDRAPHRDTVLWNVMIRGYANSGPSIHAVALYHELRRSSNPSNCFTFAFVLKACAGLDDCRDGHSVHSQVMIAGFHSDLFVANALIGFYAKHGRVEDARRVFDEIPVRDVVSWNSMMACYGRNCRAGDAINLLRPMLRVIEPDRVTLVSILPACASTAAVHEGMWAHCRGVKTGMGVDAVLGSGLIEMYGSCGILDDARKVFDRIPEMNLVVCNSMIRAYGVHGRAQDSLEIFSRMLEAGVRPDGICFVCVLSACSHAGMVEEGRKIFKLMESYDVEKSQIHYACMVDVLARSGRLREALKFIEGMPVEPERDVWGALLGACRIYNEVGLAEEAAKRLFLLDPANAGRYAVLAKMYEDVGRLEDAARLRKAMRDQGVRKPMGCSTVEVDCEVHSFGVEDESHPMTDEIYIVLKHLQEAVKEVMENQDLGVMTTNQLQFHQFH